MSRYILLTRESVLGSEQNTEGQLDSGQLAFHPNIVQSRQDLFLVKGFLALGL